MKIPEIIIAEIISEDTEIITIDEAGGNYFEITISFRIIPVNRIIARHAFSSLSTRLSAG
jgi:hypothetical protein